MKLKKESIEIKDSEMDLKSDLPNDDDSLGNASAASTTVDSCQLNNVSAEQVISIPKKKVSVKQEVFELFLIDESVPQNIDSESEDCIITSTSKSNSSENQEFRKSPEENIPSYKEEVCVKREAIEVFLNYDSVPQNINSKVGDYMGASTSKSNLSESQEFKISSEENLPSYKEKASVKQEAIEVFLDYESVRQNTYSKSEDCIITSTSKSNSSKSQEPRIFSKEKEPLYKEKVPVKQEGLEGLLVDESVPQNTNSKSEDCIITSTSKSNSSESQEFKISSEGNISSYKEKVSVKQEDFERFFRQESLPQNLLSKFVDYMRASKSDSNSSESQECKISSKENSLASKEEEGTKLEDSDVCMTDISNPPNSVGELLTRQMDSNGSHRHETAAKENVSAEIPSEVLFVGDSKSHRQNIHYSSDSSDYESDSSSSWDEFYDKLHKNVVPSQLPTLKTKGELLIQDLPPVEDLDINVNATELLKIGSILHSVISKECNEFFVVVESDGNSNPIDADSVLFLSSDKPLGKIHDVFGSVSKPKYTVRFNKGEDIHDKGITAGQNVYYLPENNDLTHYVLVDVLKQQKGSDASWKDNNEPPDDQIDYSDDEQEKLAKQKRRAKRRNDRNLNDEEGEDSAPNKVERKHATYNRERTFLARPSRNHFRSPAPSVSRSSPHSYSSQNFESTLPPPNVFNLQRNVISPQPFGLISPNNNRPAFPQSSMPASLTFGPFSSRNVQSPQPFGLSPHSNVPSPHTYELLQPSRMPPPIGTFPPSSVSSYFTVPPTSNVLSSPNFAPPHSTSIQQNPSTLMAAPQNNVPLQQQLLHRPVASFMSHPPPNYNPNQNTRPFLHQIQSFAPPMFGAPPAIRPAMQNIPNHLSVNQILFPLGSNCPPTSLSGNLNISPLRNITPTNLNGYQGQSSGIMQPNSNNSFLFSQISPINTQHNNVHPQITQPVFIPSQSPLLSPCPTPPFVPCQTPPPSMINQQGYTLLSSSGPPVLPGQTPPPTMHPLAFTLSAVRSPMPPQNFPFS